MFCPNCGNQLSDNAQFCSSCGARMASDAAPRRIHASQRQSAIDAKTKAALRLGGFGIVAVGVFSILVCLVWHQYEHFTNYISVPDNTLLLTQSCMAVGGILMICMPKPKAALQIGGIALLVLSTLSVLVCFHYHQSILSELRQTDWKCRSEHKVAAKRTPKNQRLYGR